MPVCLLSTAHRSSEDRRHKNRRQASGAPADTASPSNARRLHTLAGTGARSKTAVLLQPVVYFALPGGDTFVTYTCRPGCFQLPSTAVHLQVPNAQGWRSTICGS